MSRRCVRVLPLKRARWESYLSWAVRAFRLATVVAEPSTQVVTHLCYSEFADILPVRICPAHLYPAAYFDAAGVMSPKHPAHLRSCVRSCIHGTKTISGPGDSPHVKGDSLGCMMARACLAWMVYHKQLSWHNAHAPSPALLWARQAMLQHVTAGEYVARGALQASCGGEALFAPVSMCSDLYRESHALSQRLRSSQRRCRQSTGWTLTC